MATTAEVSTIITTIQELTASAATIVEQADPGVAVTTAEAAALVATLTQLVEVGTTALAMAQGMAITADSIAALKPDLTPLDAPTGGN